MRRDAVSSTFAPSYVVSSVRALMGQLLWTFPVCRISSKKQSKHATISSDSSTRSADESQSAVVRLFWLRARFGEWRAHQAPDPLTTAEAIVMNDIKAKMHVKIVSEGLATEICA